MGRRAWLEEVGASVEAVGAGAWVEEVGGGAWVEVVRLNDAPHGGPIAALRRRPIALRVPVVLRVPVTLLRPTVALLQAGVIAGVIAGVVAGIVARRHVVSAVLQHDGASRRRRWPGERRRRRRGERWPG